MKKILLGLSLGCLAVSTPALAVDGIYVGGEVGAVGLSSSFGSSSTAIGFGGDLGVRVNPLIDVVGRVMHSSHTGTTLTSTTFSADFRLAEVNDFEFAIGAGPGFYFLGGDGLSVTKFGLNYGGNVDVVVNETVHIGVGARYHHTLSSTTANHWMVTMRVGFLFGAG
jgi:hypothetical protein